MLKQVSILGRNIFVLDNMSSEYMRQAFCIHSMCWLCASLQKCYGGRMQNAFAYQQGGNVGVLEDVSSLQSENSWWEI